MKIGAIKESKNKEYRACLTPASVIELIHNHHEVFIESGLGLGIGINDETYEKIGAKVVNKNELFHQCELLIKVKEPTEEECKLLKPHHVLFTFLHLASLPLQTKLLKESNATCIAYETVTDKYNKLPLLAPMSEVAGRLAILSGVNFLLKNHNGSGVLLNGVAGVEQGVVVIIGAGVVGANALLTAVGIGSKVIILDKDMEKLRYLDQIYGNKITTLYSNKENIAKSIAMGDLIVGAVLIPGAVAPKIITKDMLKLIKKGSVLVDVAIDQGGCFETSKPTSYDNPTYEVDGIIHYCVANMPGGVSKSSSYALNNATLPYILEIANHGYKDALQKNPHLLNGLNVYKGHITHELLANSINEVYHKPDFK